MGNKLRVKLAYNQDLTVVTRVAKGYILYSLSKSSLGEVDVTAIGSLIDRNTLKKLAHSSYSEVTRSVTSL